MPISKDNRPIVIFDGSCGFCSDLVKYLREKDKKSNINFISDTTEQALFISTKFKNFTLPVKSLIFIHENKTATKSKAAILITGYLPFPWSLLKILHVFPSSFLDLGYDFISNRRYKFSNKIICEDNGQNHK